MANEETEQQRNSSSTGSGQKPEPAQVGNILASKLLKKKPASPVPTPAPATAAPSQPAQPTAPKFANSGTGGRLNTPTPIPSPTIEPVTPSSGSTGQNFQSGFSRSSERGTFDYESNRTDLPQPSAEEPHPTDFSNYSEHFDTPSFDSGRFDSAPTYGEEFAQPDDYSQNFSSGGSSFGEFGTSATDSASSQSVGSFSAYEQSFQSAESARTQPQQFEQTDHYPPEPEVYSEPEIYEEPVFTPQRTSQRSSVDDSETYRHPADENRAAADEFPQPHAESYSSETPNQAFSGEFPTPADEFPSPENEYAVADLLTSVEEFPAPADDLPSPVEERIKPAREAATPSPRSSSFEAADPYETIPPQAFAGLLAEAQEISLRSGKAQSEDLPVAADIPPPLTKEEIESADLFELEDSLPADTAPRTGGMSNAFAKKTEPKPASPAASTSFDPEQTTKLSPKSYVLKRESLQPEAPEKPTEAFPGAADIERIIADADAMMSENNIQVAEAQYGRAIARLDAAGVGNSPLLSKCLDRYADVLSDMGKNKDALPQLRRLLVIQETVRAPDRELISTLYKIALISERLNLTSEADSTYKRAFRLGQQSLVPGDPLLAKVLEGYGNMLMRTGEGGQTAPRKQENIQAPPKVSNEAKQNPVPAPERATSDNPKSEILDTLNRRDQEKTIVQSKLSAEDIKMLDMLGAKKESGGSSGAGQPIVTPSTTIPPTGRGQVRGDSAANGNAGSSEAPPQFSRGGKKPKQAKKEQSEDSDVVVETAPSIFVSIGIMVGAIVLIALIDFVAIPPLIPGSTGQIVMAVLDFCVLAAAVGIYRFVKAMKQAD